MIKSLESEMSLESETGDWEVDWRNASEGGEPHERISIPEFADGFAYRLDAFPWVAEKDVNPFKPLTRKHVQGTGQDRITFKPKATTTTGFPGRPSALW